MLSNGTRRLPPAAIAGLVLAAVLTPAAGYARGDSGVESLFDEYRPMAYAKSVLPVLPTPLCGGGEFSRSPLFVAGDGSGDFGFLVQQVGDQAESLYRLARGGDCVTQLEFALPLDARLAGGGTCSLTTTQDLVAHPDPGYVLHSLSGLDDQQATCFVTFRVALATGAREPVLDSSVVAAPVVSFNASPWSTDIRQPVFTTVERMASVVPDGSFDLTDILRAGDPVATETCATATVDEFRARPVVSGSRVLVNADFDESSCQGGVTQGLLLVTYEAGGDSWTAAGVVAREPGTGEAVVPSGTIGHPDVEMFVTNGVNQTTSEARAYTLDVSADGLSVAANPVEDLYADVGVEPDLLSIFRSFAPGRTVAGRPVMLGVADCRYRGVAEASGCLLAVGPPPGSDGAQQRRRLARVVGWGRDLPGYAPGRFVEARYAETSGDNVLMNIDEYDVGGEYFGRGFHQLSFDGYRPSTVVDDKLRLARALADGGLRIEQVKPLAGSPLLDAVDVGATARGFVTARRDGEQVLAGLREGSLVAEVYGLDGGLRTAVDFSGLVDARALFRLRDHNGNDADELGLAGFDESGQTVVTVRDGGDGQQLASWTTGAEYRSGFAAVLDDLNGNGSEELALLGVGLDGEARAEVRDGLTGEIVNTVVYGSKLRALGLAAVPNRKGQRRWLAMFGTDDSGKTTAITRNVSTGGLVKKTGYGRKYVPVAFGTYLGFGAEQGAALVVVGTAVSGEHRVLLKNAITGEKLARFVVPRRYVPVDVTEVKDYSGDGVADILIVAADLDGNVRLTVKDPVTGQTVRSFFAD